MRSHRTLLRLRGMVEDAEATAEAMSAELARREGVIQALRTLIDARADLAKAGWALVPLEPTEAMVEAGYYSLMVPTSTAISPNTEPLLVAEIWRAMVAAAAEPDDPA